MESKLFSDRAWLCANRYFSPLFTEAGIHPTQVVNGLRHVDDVLIFSRILCTTCLLHLLEHTYKTPLLFEVEGRPPVAEFLDLTIRARGNRLAYALRQKNEAWTYGREPHVTKTALPCVLGKPVIAMRRVQAFLRVKLHRVHQVHKAGDPRRFSAVVDIMSEIHKLGYPTSLIIRALNGIRNPNIVDMSSTAMLIALRFKTSIAISCMMFIWQHL